MVHVVTYASFIETLQHTSSAVVESRDRCYMTQVARTYIYILLCADPAHITCKYATHLRIRLHVGASL
jgi:hypothetical protein